MTESIPLPHPRYAPMLGQEGGILWACCVCGKELWLGDGAPARATIDHQCGGARVLCYLGLGLQQGLPAMCTHDFGSDVIWSECK